MLETGQMNRNSVEMVNIDMLVPKDHLLRKIDAAIDFTKIYEFVKDLYSDLLHENPRITSCFFGNFFADLFFQIGAGFDVGPIHECRFGIQIACLCRFL